MPGNPAYTPITSTTKKNYVVKKEKKNTNGSKKVKPKK